METITTKLPSSTARWLEAQAREQQRSKSAIVREALERMKAAAGGRSALDLAGDAVGRGASGQRDLGSNRRHMRGFGR